MEAKQNEETRQSSAGAPESEYLCSVHDALVAASKAVVKSSPGLSMKIPHHITVAELMRKVSPAVQDLPGDVSVPRMLCPRARQRLREVALENMAMWRAEEAAREAATPRVPATRPIKSAGLLVHTDAPPLPTPEQRQRLKDQFKEFLADSKPPSSSTPAPLRPDDNFRSNPLPMVRCNLTLSAVDHEAGMAESVHRNTLCFWDTGTLVTTITEDVLRRDFVSFLRRPVHDAYRSNDAGDGTTATRVYLSCDVEFSNRRVVRIGTFANVLSSSKYHRSAIVLGQLGAINRIQYESVPRQLLEAQNGDSSDGKEALNDGEWGLFNVKKYVDLDGKLVVAD